MTADVRETRHDEIRLLPAIECSAASIFATMPDLAWLTNHPLIPLPAHADYVGRGTSWVAVTTDDRPIAFLVAQAFADELHIREIAVRAGHHRRGLGRALIDTAVGYARERRLTAVTLTTFRDVAWNAPYYARLRFRILARADRGRRLTDVLAREVGAGLPGERRCAMRLDLA